MAGRTSGLSPCECRGNSSTGSRRQVAAALCKRTCGRTARISLATSSQLSATWEAGWEGRSLSRCVGSGRRQRRRQVQGFWRAVQRPGASGSPPELTWAVPST